MTWAGLAGKLSKARDGLLRACLDVDSGDFWFFFFILHPQFTFVTLEGLLSKIAWGQTHHSLMMAVLTLSKIPGGPPSPHL